MPFRTPQLQEPVQAPALRRAHLRPPAQGPAPLRSRQTPEPALGLRRVLLRLRALGPEPQSLESQPHQTRAPGLSPQTPALVPAPRRRVPVP